MIREGDYVSIRTGYGFDLYDPPDFRRSLGDDAGVVYEVYGEEIYVHLTEGPRSGRDVRLGMNAIERLDK